MNAIVTAILMVIVFTLSASNAYALDVFIHIEITGANLPTVRAKTNLPDTTKVVVGLYNESLNYFEQFRTEVVAGTFEGGPFKDNDNAIRPGTYTATVAVELAQFQPPMVQSVIGCHGEELQGSLVHQGMLGRKVFYSTRLAVD